MLLRIICPITSCKFVIDSILFVFQAYGGIILSAGMERATNIAKISRAECYFSSTILNIMLLFWWCAQNFEHNVSNPTPVCGTGGRGFKPRPDQHSEGFLNNWEESAAFVSYDICKRSDFIVFSDKYKKNRKSRLTALSPIWFLWEVREPTPLFAKGREWPRPTFPHGLGALSVRRDFEL